jgi:NADPH-dependent 2,4-dienoyl-CoA reductase/sulfur reductase-like enzyme
MIREWVETKGIKVRTQAGVERIDLGTDSPLLVKLTTGETLPCDLLIVAAGVVPNVSFLEATPVHVAKGVLVNDHMETSVPGIYAAGDVAEAPDLFTGAHLVSAIQPNAADQARVAALNMAGQNVKLPGVLAINVLDTLGLISSSFGQWWGTEEKDGVELVDKDHYRYLSLQFQGDVLIGATSIGLTQHVGVLRGLIQNRTKLGRWKKVLAEAPLRFPEAYVACSQQPTALIH